MSTSTSTSWNIRHIDGLDFGLLRGEFDIQQALDLRFSHYLQREPLVKSYGGNPERNEETEAWGRRQFEGETNFVCKDPKNGGKVVGYLVMSL